MRPKVYFAAIPCRGVHRCSGIKIRINGMRKAKTEPPTIPPIAVTSLPRSLITMGGGWNRGDCTWSFSQKLLVVVFEKC